MNNSSTAQQLHRRKAELATLIGVSAAIMTAVLTVTIVMSRGVTAGRCLASFQSTRIPTQFRSIVSSKQHLEALASPKDNGSHQSGQQFATSNDKNKSNNKWKVVDVPLVFVPGMKGTHLAFKDDNTGKKKRAWLTLGNLLNFPPKPDGYFERDLSLPLTYDSDGRQHYGPLSPDGIVDHIIEFSSSSDSNANNGSYNNTRAKNFVDLNLLPFYGHTTRLLKEVDRQYHLQKHDGKEFSTAAFEKEDDEANNIGNKGIFDRVGRFVERTSNWAFTSTTNTTADEQEALHHSHAHCRPTAVFTYDWRRSLPELCDELHTFCEETFPNQPVQILAHSLGGLMTFACMRKYPQKYEPGAVVVGVPFETGIQYLQDLHKGYYTELDRCRQFKPEAQFTMSSHWSFFPISKKRLEDRFVDVTNTNVAKFDADKSGIGISVPLQPKPVAGENAYFDFYNPDDWERLQLGVFSPEYDDKLTKSERDAYKSHMNVQMDAAKQWRKDVFGEDEDIDNDSNDDIIHSPVLDKFPPFVACQSNTVPTVNQYLRRKRKISTQNQKGQNAFNTWEYDYLNGRSVPGDGRIDFDKSFPPSFISHKRVTLRSAHAKQMCWEESGGSLNTVYKEVISMTEDYLDLLKKRELDAEMELRASLKKEEMFVNNNSQGKSIMTRIVGRARKARKRLRIRRGMDSDERELVIIRRSRNRFSLRKKRRG